MRYQMEPMKLLEIKIVLHQEILGYLGNITGKFLNNGILWKNRAIISLHILKYLVEI